MWWLRTLATGSDDVTQTIGAWRSTNNLFPSLPHPPCLSEILSTAVPTKSVLSLRTALNLVYSKNIKIMYSVLEITDPSVIDCVL
jgi:hypothetical protein